MTRIAVIGSGRMGRNHIRVIRSLGHELVGVSDSSPDALASTASECTVAPELLYGDPMAMLEAVRPSCVIVSTTAQSHAEFVVASVRAGATHVLCEKPMASSIAECDRMIRVTAEQGVRLAVNHQMRFMQRYTVPKILVDSASIGRLTSVTVIAGNVGLAMNGSHYFEMLRFMTGEPVEQVAAWLSDAGVNPRGSQYEDRAGSVRATTASGRRLYMEIGADQGHGVTVVYGGRHGQIVVNDLTGLYHIIERRPDDRALPTSRYSTPTDERSERIPLPDVLSPTREVLRGLLSDGDHPTGEDGRSTVACLVAAYVSHEHGGTPIRLDDHRVDRDRSFPWA